MFSSLGRSTLFSMPKAAGMQLFSSDSEQPRRASPWGTRGLLTTTRYDERALSIDELGDLSIDHNIASATQRLEQSKTKISHRINMSSSIEMRPKGGLASTNRRRLYAFFFCSKRSLPMTFTQ